MLSEDWRCNETSEALTYVQYVLLFAGRCAQKLYPIAVIPIQYFEVDVKYIIVLFKTTAYINVHYLLSKP